MEWLPRLWLKRFLRLCIHILIHTATSIDPASVVIQGKRSGDRIPRSNEEKDDGVNCVYTWSNHKCNMFAKTSSSGQNEARLELASVSR